MRIHFIAVGGSIMHNLALALQRAGHDVSGSDDEIYEPSRSRLERAGLLPSKMGWDDTRVTSDLDAVILGMHARKDNPELLKAENIGVRIYSFPEFVRSVSEDKKRVVVAGSHGKTSTTSMIMHVLKTAGFDFDYLVGAQLPDFDLMVRLSGAPVIIIEGDEYLSSPLDRRPKFVHYDPDVTIITGIAWDHMNVFPTIEIYEDQFRSFIQKMEEDTKVFYYENDRALQALFEEPHAVRSEAYGPIKYEMAAGELTIFDSNNKAYHPKVFGKHNMENMEAARRVCMELGVAEALIFEGLETFSGAAMRLQYLLDGPGRSVLRDFAHAPSKVRATVKAVREKYTDKTITALVELHTFSSLNKAFMPEYKDSLDSADRGIVFYSPHTVAMKKLEDISPEEVKTHFGGSVDVYTTPEELTNALQEDISDVHLLMSSGRFGGIDLDELYPSETV